MSDPVIYVVIPAAGGAAGASRCIRSLPPPEPVSRVAGGRVPRGVGARGQASEAKCGRGDLDQ